jgi:hypothetical protein
MSTAKRNSAKVSKKRTETTNKKVSRLWKKAQEMKGSVFYIEGDDYFNKKAKEILKNAIPN